MFVRLYEMPVVQARIFMTYGPGQEDLGKLIPSVSIALLKSQRPSISSGARLVDWIYVDDVAAGLVAAALAPGLPGGAVDLGSGALVSIRDVVEMRVELTGSTVTADFGAQPDRASEEVRAADMAGTTARLGWRPEISLREGLARTVAWCRSLIV